jgi:gliding motility-associated-like protein
MFTADFKYIYMLSKITTISLCSLFVLFFIQNNLEAKPRTLTNIVIQYNSGGNAFYENCNALDGKVIFTFEQITSPGKYLIQFGGAATFNIDFTLLGFSNDTLNITPNNPTIEFPIHVIKDGIAEGSEDIIVNLIDLATGQVVASLTTYIFDNFQVTINNDTDIEACPNEDITLTASDGNSFSWTPSSNVSDPTASSVKYTGNGTSQVTLTATIGTCESSDKINVVINNTSVVLTSSKDTLCGGETIKLTATPETSGGVYSWEPAQLFPNPNSNIQNVYIDKNTQVIVTYTLGDCFSSDTLSLKLRPGTEYFPPFNDTTVCYKVPVSFGDFSKAKFYEFDPSSGINFTDINNPIYIALNDANYTVKITSTDKKCSFEHDFQIKVNEGRFSLKTPEYVELCKGDSTKVEYSFYPKASKVIWTPADSTFIVVNDSAFIAKPTVTTTYTGTFIVGNCVYTESVVVRVDSIPDIPLDHQPIRPFYCKGEVVAMFSPQYDKSLYPDITFNWGNALGAVDPKDQLNLAIITQDTFLYIRKTVNHACYREDSLQINVKIPKIQFSLTDTLVCENEEVRVDLNTDMTDIEWTPAESVTCFNDCKTAIIKTATTTTYTVTGKADGCPGTANMTVRINRQIIGLSVTDTTICPNEPVKVSVVSAASNISWSPGEKTSCKDCPTTVLTTDKDQNFIVSGIQDGCPAYGGIIVKISPPSIFEITVSPADNVAIGNPVTASVVNPVPEGTYQWKINGRDLGTHGSSYEIVLESKDDLIEAFLIPSGDNYCSGSGKVQVSGITPYINMPNSFSPNGDSKNDVFKAVIPDGVKLLELSIVNRWGQQVYNEKNSNNGWDGTYKGKEAPSDTYVFIVKYQLSQGGIIDSRRGEVTLYR